PAAAGAPPFRSTSQVRRRQGGEQLLAPLGGRRRRSAHGIGAQREEEVAVGIHKPPLAIDLLDAEESGGFGFRAHVAAVPAGREVALAERLLLSHPGGLQL